MKAVEPQPVKYFIGALYSDAVLVKEAQVLCAEAIGSLEHFSEAFPFTDTHYYDVEMGTPIWRLFWGFETLMSPGYLARLKMVCNGIEERLQVDGHRKVNLDIGYLDLHKLILASAKYNGQKIYLDEGIYADFTLIYERGAFHAVENTFPDFKSGEYNPVFMAFRQRYKQQLKLLSL